MSMVTDITGALRKAMTENKHPSCIKISSRNHALLAETLRRADPERRNVPLLPRILGSRLMPHLDNAFDKQVQVALPRRFVVTDVLRKLKMEVPIISSPMYPDDGFRIEFDAKPYEKVYIKTQEEDDAEFVEKLRKSVRDGVEMVGGEDFAVTEHGEN